MRQASCENCFGTGYYGDNGPGRKGNKEYVQCECQKTGMPTEYQVIELTLSNGMVIFATVQKFCDDDDNLSIIKATFSSPKPLPEGCKFERMPT